MYRLLRRLRDFGGSGVLRVLRNLLVAAADRWCARVKTMFEHPPSICRSDWLLAEAGDI